MKVFTLKNCDSCKKAVRFMEAEGIAFDHHDVRADGLTRADIEPLIASVGADALVNRRSTTWRGLDEATRERALGDDAASVIADHPTLMKRPVFVTEQEVMVGFGDDVKAWLKS